MSSIMIPRPHRKQRQVLVSPARYKVLNWGRRSGKSTLAATHTLTEALKRQGNYYICAPTYKQAKSIYWDAVLKTVVPKELIAAINNVELKITLKHIQGEVTLPNGETIYVEHDERKPPSVIYLKGVDNPDALRGVALHGCVMDEFAFMANGKDIFDLIISPALGDYKGWCMFISTPNGIHNPFYDIVQLAQDPEVEDYYFSHATALDNPYFPTEEFEAQRKKYKSEGKEDLFAQEWEAKFTTPSRLVYREFDRNVHLIDREDIPFERLTHVMSIDFGWTDPFAVAFIGIDEDNTWYMYDEIYQTDLTTDRALNLMRSKMGNNHFSRILGDGANPTEIANFKERRFYIQPSTKGHDSIKAGIREVASLLALREMPGGKMVPKFYLAKHCKFATKEFESYSNLLDAFGEVLDMPEDKNNHLMDCIRYMALEYARSQKPRVRRQFEYDPVTGRKLGVKR